MWVVRGVKVGGLGGMAGWLQSGVGVRAGDHVQLLEAKKFDLWWY